MAKHISYPLLFEPRFIEVIWGGRRLHDRLKRKTDPNKNIGESWEISDVEGEETPVANGPYKGMLLHELVERFPQEILGEEVLGRMEDKTRFPLLIKYLDTAKPLSIQVHPDNPSARRYHDCLGKSEMWYVLEHEPNAKVIAGFNQTMTKEEFVGQVEEGEIEKSLNHIFVAEDDYYNIPSGRIHALGEGLLLAEVQQTSDITYRVYDYKRKDKNGKERELHLEKALEVLNLDDLGEDLKDRRIGEQAKNTCTGFVKNDYFKVGRLCVEGSLQIEKPNTAFRIYMVVEGSAKLHYEDQTFNLPYGETILLPASVTSYAIEGKAKLLGIGV